MYAWLGQLLTGAASLLICSACANQRDNDLRMLDELAQARAEAKAADAHAAALEARLLRLERSAPLRASSAAPVNRAVLDRLDYLIRINEGRLSEAQNDAFLPEESPGARTADADGSRLSASTAEQELRGLVERLRGRRDRFHGPLTREQEKALRVLLHPERQLDVESPWATPLSDARR